MLLQEKRKNAVDVLLSDAGGSVACIFGISVAHAKKYVVAESTMRLLRRES